MKKILFFFLTVLLFNCKEVKKEPLPSNGNSNKTSVSHAKGFTIEKSKSGITIITISSPWLNAENSFTYALVPKEKMATITLNKDYDAIIAIPVTKIVVTSTTHIPALDALGVENQLVGFPKTDLISSKKIRKRIASGHVQELGNNQNINTETVLALQPELVVGFGVTSENKVYETLQRSGIPVVYNGDWTEETPLGKAEWIKFFAPFFQKEKLAESIFKNIETEYNNTKKLVTNVKRKPTVLTGGLYKDVWHVAGGASWMAQFLNDAKANYLWSHTESTGGIPLSIESVLATGHAAEFWFNPSLHTTYQELENTSPHYLEFEAFKNKRVFSNCIAKGATGGLLFYELAPQRPDMVLKDLIRILHPEILPEHELFFFKPLE